MSTNPPRTGDVSGHLAPPGTIATEALLLAAQASPSGCVVLVVTRGPNAGSRFVLNQPIITVGRHLHSDVFLDEVTVSRRHAEVRCAATKFG